MNYNLPGYDTWKTDYPEDDPEYEIDNDQIETEDVED